MTFTFLRALTSRRTSPVALPRRIDWRTRTSAVPAAAALFCVLAVLDARMLLAMESPASSVNEEPAATASVVIQLRIEDDVPIDLRDLKAIAEQVVNIWRPYFDTTVAIVPAAKENSITAPLHVTITNRFLDGVETEALGWIDFVDGEPQPALTVSFGAVRHLMRTGTWAGKSLETMAPAAGRLFRRRALAVAVAHEMGHFLLKTKSHERRGLMSTSFTVDEIMDTRPRALRIEPSQAAALRLASASLARQSGEDPNNVDTPTPGR